MKVIYDGTTLEGTPEEIKEMMTLMGADFPVKESDIPTEDVAEKTPQFKEGDRVKALADGEFRDIKAGEIGVIADTDAGSIDDQYYIEVTTDDGYDYFRPQDLELVTEEENPYKPSEGDIVVITGESHFEWCSNEVGDIGKVVGRGQLSKTSVKVSVPGRYQYANYTHESEMRPATDEEKAQYKQALKITKLGRKPGEFKRGDIVRITKYELGAKVGSIREIWSVSDEVISYKDDGCIFGASYWAFELIAPVEARVDV